MVRLSTRIHNKPSIYPFFLAELALLIKNSLFPGYNKDRSQKQLRSGGGGGGGGGAQEPDSIRFLSLSLSRTNKITE